MAIYIYISLCVFFFNVSNHRISPHSAVRTGQIQRGMLRRPSSLGAVAAGLWGRRGAHGDLQKGHEGGAAAERRSR